MSGAGVNDLLRNFRSKWPGGLSESQYSTLNLIAHCRHGELGFNRAECSGCHRGEWYPSSCGDRHCPRCLGPRQASWSESVCERLADCPHFHVVFTGPTKWHEFFELNYRRASEILFASAAETLRTFQKNNWKMEGAFFGVLHTWGSQLNWHPHLHVLVSAGGRDLETGRWKQARANYLFAVKVMSKIFRGIILKKIEEVDEEKEIVWPAGLASLEQRRDWRLELARAGWNIFSRPTLGNTRAVVRYLARYTSRIAISNHRIRGIDEEKNEVIFEWKNYRADGRKEEKTLSIAAFLHRFCRYLVPKGFRRIRYYGWLAGGKDRLSKIPNAPKNCVGEKAVKRESKVCEHCQGKEWTFHCFYTIRTALMQSFSISQGSRIAGEGSFSLGATRAP